MRPSWKDYLRKVLGWTLPAVVGSVWTPQTLAAVAVGRTEPAYSTSSVLEPLTLTPPLHTDVDQFARGGGRGHSSHSSHASHSSHSSHYSGSRGSTATPPDRSTTPTDTNVAPSNRPTAPATAAPRPAAPPVSAVSPPAAGAAAAAPTVNNQELIRAMRVQLELKRLGHYNGPIDGVVGPGTRNALKRFQSSQKLDPSGNIDGSTLGRLGVAP